MDTTKTVMTLTHPTTGEDRTREIIELAANATPFCEACGSPTTPVAQGDDMWLACTSTQEPQSMLRRLFSFEPLIGHTRRLVLEGISERLAA